MILKGFHHCLKRDIYGDWRINNKNMILDLTNIIHLLTEDKLKLINHNEIAWKGMDNKIPDSINDTKDRKFIECNIGYPCILINNGPNPKNLKYRMIDGTHRMAKMKMMNITKSYFYILEMRDIYQYFMEI